MTMITSRVSAGVPSGGQFASPNRGESDVFLDHGRDQPGAYVDVERHDWMDSSFLVEVNEATGFTDDEFYELNKNYLEAAVWATTDDSDDEGRELDERFDISNFTPRARARAAADLQKFLADNRELVAEALAIKGYAVDESGSVGRLAHDLWLTRNGHGTGFWDRAELSGRLGRELTDAAQEFGELHITVLSDEEIEFV